MAVVDTMCVHKIQQLKNEIIKTVENINVGKNQ